MEVVFLPEADMELAALQPREQAALLAAVEKLEAHGDRLSFPHSSNVQGARAAPRELRPRSGRSAWRAFYRRVGSVMVVASVGPEATSDPRGFQRAVAAALNWLDDGPRVAVAVAMGTL